MKSRWFGTIFLLLAIVCLVAAVSDCHGAALPTSGDVRLAAGSVTPVTAPTEVGGAAAGSLTIAGSRTRPTIQNLQTAAFAPVFRLGAGDALTVLETIVTGKYVGSGKANRAIHVEGGRLVLRNVTFVDGEGVALFRGAIDWDFGGSADTYAYGLYAGNNMAGDDFIATGRVSRCVFEVGRAETGVRLMGFNGELSACTFNADTDAGRRHQKESLQARHGSFVVRGCTSHAWLIGSLDPSIDGGKHTDYAQRSPTYAYVVDHTQAGYLAISGKSYVAIERLRVTGPEPRGVGNAAGPAVWEKVYQTRHGEQRPVVYIRDSAVDGYAAFADADFVIGPGCTLAGRPVAVSVKWSQAEFDRIKAQASRYLPPATLPSIRPATQPATQPVLTITVPAGVREIRIEMP